MLLKGIVYVVGLLLWGIWGSWGAPVQTAVSLRWCGVRGRTLVTLCAFFSWNKGLPCISSAVFALLLRGTPALADGSVLSSGNMLVVIWQAFFFSWFHTCESFYCLFIFFVNDLSLLFSICFKAELFYVPQLEFLRALQNAIIFLTALAEIKSKILDRSPCHTWSEGSLPDGAGKWSCLAKQGSAAQVAQIT